MKVKEIDHDIFYELIPDDRLRQAVIKKIESIDPIELLKNKVDEYELNDDDESNPYSINLEGFFIGDDSNPEAQFGEIILEYIIYSIFTNRYCSKVRSAYTLESSESTPVEGRLRSSSSKSRYTSKSGGKFTVYTGRFGFKLELDPDTLQKLIDDISEVQSIAGYIFEELKSNLLRHWLKKSQGESHIFHHKVSLDYNQKMLELILGLDSTIHRDLANLDDINLELSKVVDSILSEHN